MSNRNLILPIQQKDSKIKIAPKYAEPKKKSPVNNTKGNFKKNVKQPKLNTKKNLSIHKPLPRLSKKC